MESNPDEVVMVVERYKLRNNAFTTVGKKNIAVNAESHYSRGRRPMHILKSPEQRAVPGCTIYVPWAETIVGLVLNVHSIQDRLTCFLGQAEVTTEYFGTQPTKLDLYIKNCGEIVGTMSVSVFVRQIFLEQGPPAPAETALKVQKPVPAEDIGSYCVPTPDGFRFNRLARPVNWERLRSINLRRVAENVDVSSLTAALDDVLTGDVGDEEVDPRLDHALKAAQLTAQYIVAGNRLLKSKQAIIERGITAFDNEEDRLDLQLSKLRAKCRARQRELDDLDALELKYSKLLKYCDPKMASAHRKEEKRRKMREEYDSEKRDRQSRGNTSKAARPREAKKTSQDDDSVRSSGGSLAAEDKSDVGSGHVFKWRESTADEEKPDKHLDVSVDTDIGVTPKLLILKPVSKEEKFRRFHVIKKPDAPLDSTEWVQAKLRPESIISSVSAENSIPVYTDDQMDYLRMGKKTQLPPNTGTMASSTAMSVDSLLPTADTVTVSPDRVADSGGTSPEAKQDLGPVSEVVPPFPWVSAAVAINVQEPEVNCVVPFLPTDLVQSPVISAKASASPRRDGKTTEDPQDQFVHASALESSLEITELGEDTVMSPERGRAIGQPKETCHRVGDIVSGNSAGVDTTPSENNKAAGDTHNDSARPVSPQGHHGVAGAWGRHQEHDIEMQEHNDIFEPTCSFEYTTAKSAIVSFSETIPVTQEATEVTIADIPRNERNVGIYSEHSDGEVDKAIDGDILSPLGVVGTAILRKRAAGGVGSSSVASDEDDRVLMGTLHHYDSTGAISMDTNDQSMNSSTQFDISEDPDVSVPVKDPPIPPALRITLTGDAPEEEKSRTPPPSAMETADSSVGFEVNAADISTDVKSFGEESSEINMSQGFVDTLAARYLNPGLLAESGEDVDAANEADQGSEHGDLPTDPEDIAEEEEIIKWMPGRASLDLIETAMAVDAYASSIRLDSEYLQNTQIKKIQLRFNFLDATSASSPPISGNVRDSSLSISMNFGAHIEFDRKGFKILAEEVENERDDLALQVVVFGEIQRSDDEDDIEDKVIGIASVNMWFMIEDSCAIVLQEVDIVDVDSGTVIGTVVVDVRGHLCLMECS